jgi:hypothetical protein
VYGDDISLVKIKLHDSFFKISVLYEDEKYSTTIVAEKKKGIIDTSYKLCLSYEEIYNSILSYTKKIEK